MSETLEKFRLFIAIPVPEAVKDEIEKAQAELRQALPDRSVQWTKRAQFHLTLKFLGNVEANRIDALLDAVKRACRDFSALQLRSERIGCFPELRFPRVVWAWVHDEREELSRLQSAIESAMKDFTSEAAEGKFTGHVTLGRSRTIKRPQAEILATLAHGMTGRVFGDWTANEVDIIRSDLSSAGSHYTVLGTAPLAKGSPEGLSAG